MVNKAAVIALAVVVFTSLSVGGLLGMQLATTQADDAELGGDSTPTQTSDEQQTQQPTETPTATQTVTPESIAEPESFNETKVALLVHEQLNAERTNRNLQSLRLDGDLTEMAVYHTEDMANKGYYSHTSPNGETTQDRYRQYELLERCKILDDSKGYYHKGAESIGRTTAGVTHTVNGEQRVNEDEQQVATALVERWLTSETDSSYMTLEYARSVGIGVRITAEGTVYATAAYC